MKLDPSFNPRVRIPTRLNLRDRGIDLDSLLCPGCNWEVAIPVLDFVDAFVHWADGVMINREAKMAFDAVVVVTFWMIWTFRNKLLFGLEKPRKDEMFDDKRSSLCNHRSGPMVDCRGGIGTQELRTHHQINRQS
ncbi:hypothetical protein LXL04_026513 [Taraxacum kok-saghyz]